MPELSKPLGPKRSYSAILGVLLLVCLLVAAIWEAAYIGSKAPVQRASGRVVHLVEKSGAESPVMLGLVATRLEKYISLNSVLELEGYGVLATGRQGIIQYFTQIRTSLAGLAFEHSEMDTVLVDHGAINTHVVVRYRLIPERGEVTEGNGSAVLFWIKGKDGWQIARTVLTPEKGAAMPKGWK